MGFAYDADGQRLYKTDGTNETIYLVVDGVAVGESINNGQTVILYLFDENGDIYGIDVNGGDYFFRKNLQGDVVGIWDPETGDQIVTYTYDPWGKLLTVTDTTNYGLGTLNPFRYRTYYYDAETGFYYLQSRYYDPEIGRFINADGLLAGADTTNLNLFAYCGNNPVNRADDGGSFWHIVIGAAVGAAIGFVSSIVAQVVSGQEINLIEAGISAASGALTGAITAACPAMGAVATGLLHGAVGAATYAATEKFAYGRDPSVEGVIAAGVTSGVLAGVAKGVSNKIANPKIPQNAGTPFKGVGSSQVGVDPNTLTLNPNFTPNPEKYASALARIKNGGMYGVIEVTRNGLVIDGQHRTLIGRMLGIAVDVVIK